MRMFRPWRVGLAMGVMLVSGGRAADALAQERPAPAGPASVAALPARVPQMAL